MIRPLFTVIAILALYACGAGSGEGLNDDGLPIGAVTPTPNPPNGGNGGVTLAQIQAEIFNDPCANCHFGNAPAGLRLDSEENSYNFLVGANGTGVPSAQISSLLRVNPGNPDDSYLVRKLEGGPNISQDRMPKGLQPLSQDQIDMVREWIANGAQPTPTSTTDIATIVSNVSSSNNGSTVSFQFQFNRALQLNTLSDNSVQVYLQKESVQWLASPENYQLQLADKQITVNLDTSLTDADSVVININDPNYSAVLDINGRVIDGDQDQTDGGAFRFEHRL